MAGKVIAFYDLDRTLIEANSALLYTSYERQNARISWQQYVTAAFWMGLYHLNLLDIERAYGKAVQVYTGLKESELKRRVKVFFEGQIEGRLLPGARRSLKEHRDKGHLLVLLTNGSSYQASMAMAAWQMDHWIANKFPIDEKGCLLGTFEKPLCFGAGKVKRARDFADLRGASLADCYFYSDSYSDLPMLEAVGHPRVVNPDPKLRRYGKKKAWQVCQWNL